MPRVSIRRRTSGGTASRRSLTAAAQRVDARPTSGTFNKSLGSSGTWDTLAWEYLRRVGELQYFVSWRAWSASRCRMVASALDESGEPIGSIPDDDPNAARVRQFVRDIAGGAAGQARVMQRNAYLLSVVGECWAGMVVRDPSRERMPDGSELPTDMLKPGYQREQWYVFTKSQITANPNGIELKLPDGTLHTYDDSTDVLFRVWQEHPEDPTKPVSPIWSNMDTLNEIVQATATIDNSQKSRLIGNGLLFVPQEMSLPKQSSPSAAPLPGDPDDDDSELALFENGAQSLQDLIYEVGTTASKDPSSLAALMPIVAAVPGDQVKNAEWLRPATEVPKTALETRTDAIRRLAMGLDTAPERLLGMGKEANHWSAWAIDESDIKIHVAPIVELICNAFTQEVLRYKLAEVGIDPSQYVIWYDTAQLTQDPDKSEEAKDAFDRGAITSKTLREHLGFDDEAGYDFTTAEGVIEMALDRLVYAPDKAGIFLPVLQKALESLGLELQEPPEPPAIESGSGDGEDGGTPKEPGTEPAAKSSSASVTAALATQPVDAAGMTLARVFVLRGLELANKRRRNRTNTDAYRDVEIELVHTRLDPVEMSAVDGLIRGWSTGLSDADLVAVGLEPNAFRSMVHGVCAIALVTSSEPVLTASMLRRIPHAVPA